MEVHLGQTDISAKKRWSLAVLLVFSFLALSFAACGTPKFETNDDVVMSMIASGVGFVDKPNDHLLYSHFLVGRLLNSLYRLNGALPWYAIYLLTSNIISIAVITNLILRKGNRLTSQILIPIFFLSVCLRPTQLLQFTTAASLASAAGAITFLSALEGELCWRQLLKPLSGSVCLFALGAFIRFGSAKLIAVYAATFLVARVLTDRNWLKLKIGFAFFALVVGMASAAEYSNEVYYARGGWSEFYKLNPLRFSLTEFGRTTTLTTGIISSFKAVGWSPADNDMFLKMYVLDRDIYSLDHLRQLDANIPRLKQVDFNQTWSSLMDVLGNITIFPIIATSVLAVLVVSKTKLSYFSKVFYVFALCVSTVLMQITMKLPLYLFSGVIGFTAAAFIWSAASDSLADDFKKLSKAQPVFWSVLLMLTLLFWCQAVVEYREKTASVGERGKEFKTMLQGWNRDYLYVVWACGLPYEVIPPFDNIHDYFGGLKLAGINFLARTPITIERLQGFGIADLAGQITNEQIRLVSLDWLNSSMKNFVLEHYHKSVIFENTLTNDKLNVKVFKAEEINSVVQEKELSQWTEEQKAVYVCSPTDGIELTLFPSTRFQWSLLQMCHESTPRSFWPSEEFPLCSHCRAIEAIDSKYKSTGLMPTLSSFTPINIKADEMSEVFIEISIPDPAKGTVAMIEFNVGLPESKKVLIPFHVDKNLHRYELNLKKLNLPAGYMIKNMNVHPVYVRTNGSNKTFVLKRFGFVRRKADD